MVDRSALSAEAIETLARLSEELAPLLTGAWEDFEVRNDRINAGLRAAHWLGGLVRTLGMDPACLLVAVLETALEDVQLGRVDLTADVRDLLARALAVFPSLLVADNAVPPTGEDVGALVVALRRGLGSARATSGHARRALLDPKWSCVEVIGNTELFEPRPSPDDGGRMWVPYRRLGRHLDVAGRWRIVNLDDFGTERERYAVDDTWGEVEVLEFFKMRAETASPFSPAPIEVGMIVPPRGGAVLEPGMHVPPNHLEVLRRPYLVDEHPTAVSLEAILAGPPLCRIAVHGLLSIVGVVLARIHAWAHTVRRSLLEPGNLSFDVVVAQRGNVEVRPAFDYVRSIDFGIELPGEELLRQHREGEWIEVFAASSFPGARRLRSSRAVEALVRLADAGWGSAIAKLSQSDHWLEPPHELPTSMDTAREALADHVERHFRDALAASAERQLLNAPVSGLGVPRWRTRPERSSLVDVRGGDGDRREGGPYRRAAERPHESPFSSQSSLSHIDRARSKARIGDALALERIGGSSMHVWKAAWPPARPRLVVARSVEDWGSDNAMYFAWLLRLRSLVGPRYCPGVLQVYRRGDAPLGCVEEDAGDVCFSSLMDRVRGPLPSGLAMHLAHEVATAWRTLEAGSLATAALLRPRDVRIGWDGRVRLLVRPSRQWMLTKCDAEADPPDVSLRWLAPEAIRGMHRAESSMFGFGIMLFRALSGRHAFDAATELKLLEKMLDVEPAPPLDAWGVPPEVARLVQRCAEKRPERRYASWAEILAVLDQATRPSRRAAEVALADLVARLFPTELATARACAVETERLDARALLDALAPSMLEPMTIGGDAPVEETVTLSIERRHDARRPLVSLDRQRVIETWGPDGRPMVRATDTLLVDLRPVTCAEYESFLRATNRSAPASWRSREVVADRAAGLVTQIALGDAEAYARWAQKRIPNSDEWEHAVRSVGAPTLRVGAIWELTSGAPTSGTYWVVRGGPWRDRPGEAGREGNLSYSDAAPDVGFRCVADR